MQKNYFNAAGLMVLGVFAAASLVGATTSAEDQLKSQEVLSDLHHANQVEIQMGKLAKEKGSSENVRQYGERLMKDHQEADREIQTLAEKNGITLVAPLTLSVLDRVAASREERIMTDLARKGGKDFDKAFAEAMVDDHERDIDKLKDAQKSLVQPDVKDLVAKLLPTLEQHLQTAKDIKKNS